MTEETVKTKHVLGAVRNLHRSSLTVEQYDNAGEMNIGDIFLNPISNKVCIKMGPKHYNDMKIEDAETFEELWDDDDNPPPKKKAVLEVPELEPPIPFPSAKVKTKEEKKPEKKRVEDVSLLLRVDPEQLVSQKAFLIGLLAQETISFSKNEMCVLEGILNLYDYIGDMLVDEHGYSEEEIFGGLKED